jgi:hypothetical protein
LQLQAPLHTAPPVLLVQSAFVVQPQEPPLHTGPSLLLVHSLDDRH